MKIAKTVYISEIAEKIEDFSDTELRVLPEFLKHFNYMYKLMENTMKKDNE